MKIREEIMSELKPYTETTVFYELILPKDISDDLKKYAKKIHATEKTAIEEILKNWFAQELELKIIRADDIEDYEDDEDDD